MHDLAAAERSARPADGVAAPAAARFVPAIRPTDGERLMRFWRHRDEAAFAEVVEAHAPLVWGVCTQILRCRQDAEDAFQATFFILARKARSIRAADSAAGWLYRVAFRTALLARSRRCRRTELPLADEPAAADDQLAALELREQSLALLEELHALPARYRQPLVLCYFEGRSRRQAADELGVTLQSVKGRLARGTRLLRTRLVRRGIALSAAMGVASAAVASSAAAAGPLLLVQTSLLAASFGWKTSTAASAASTVNSAAAATLAQKGLIAMTLAAAAKPALALVAVCLTAGTLALATAEQPAAGDRGVALAGVSSEPAADPTSPDVALTVATADTAESLAARPSDEVATGAPTPSSAPAAAPAAAAPPSPPQPVAVMGQPAAVVRLAPTAPDADPIYGGGLGHSHYAPLSAQPGREGLALATGTLVSRPNVNTSTWQMFAPERQAELSAGQVEALTTEQEYWRLKESGLKKKAEAIQLRAVSSEKAGTAPQTEILELQAEAELTLAEAKLCQANSIRIGAMLEEGKKAAEEAQRRAQQSPAPVIRPDVGPGMMPGQGTLQYTPPGQHQPSAGVWIDPNEIRAPLPVPAAPGLPAAMPAPGATQEQARQTDLTIEKLRPLLEQLQRENEALKQRLDQLEHPGATLEPRDH